MIPAAGSLLSKQHQLRLEMRRFDAMFCDLQHFDFHFKKVKVQYKAQAFGLELISVPKQPAGVLSHKLSDLFPLLSQTTLTFRAAELHTL